MNDTIKMIIVAACSSIMALMGKIFYDWSKNAEQRNKLTEIEKDLKIITKDMACLETSMKFLTEQIKEFNKRISRIENINN